jgi:integrase
VGVEGDSTGWFNRAVERAEVQAITPHDLRRTCASLAVSSGANVLAVSRMFGHTDPSGTLGIYADLFDSDLDAVAVNLDLKISAASKTGPKHPLTVAGRAA